MRVWCLGECDGCDEVAEGFEVVDFVERKPVAYNSYAKRLAALIGNLAVLSTYRR